MNRTILKQKRLTKKEKQISDYTKKKLEQEFSIFNTISYFLLSVISIFLILLMINIVFVNYFDFMPYLTFEEWLEQEFSDYTEGIEFENNLEAFLSVLVQSSLLLLSKLIEYVSAESIFTSRFFFQALTIVSVDFLAIFLVFMLIYRQKIDYKAVLISYFLSFLFVYLSTIFIIRTILIQWLGVIQFQELQGLLNLNLNFLNPIELLAFFIGISWITGINFLFFIYAFILIQIFFYVLLLYFIQNLFFKQHYKKFSIRNENDEARNRLALYFTNITLGVMFSYVLRYILTDIAFTDSLIEFYYVMFSFLVSSFIVEILSYEIYKKIGGKHKYVEIYKIKQEGIKVKIVSMLVDAFLNVCVYYLYYRTTQNRSILITVIISIVIMILTNLTRRVLERK